jgi:hypothetical protein
LVFGIEIRSIYSNFPEEKNKYIDIISDLDPKKSPYEKKMNAIADIRKNNSFLIPVFYKFE